MLEEVPKHPLSLPTCLLAKSAGTHGLIVLLTKARSNTKFLMQSSFETRGYQFDTYALSFRRTVSLLVGFIGDICKYSAHGPIARYYKLV